MSSRICGKSRVLLIADCLFESEEKFESCLVKDPVVESDGLRLVQNLFFSEEVSHQSIHIRVNNVFIVGVGTRLLILLFSHEYVQETIKLLLVKLDSNFLHQQIYEHLWLDRQNSLLSFRLNLLRNMRQQYLV